MITEFYAHNIIQKDHFLLSSGAHSNMYINKDVIHLCPALYDMVINNFVSFIRKQLSFYNPLSKYIVTGPAIAGAMFARSVADRLKLAFIYPEKINKEMVFRRGFNKSIINSNIIIVEDIVTTGSSIEKTIKAVETNGGKVFKILCIWNRSNWNKYPIYSIINEKVDSYDSKYCPLCEQGIPLINPKENNK